MTTNDFEKINYHQIGVEIIQMHSTSLDPELVTGKYTVLKKTAFWNKRDVSIDLEITEALVNTPILLIPSTYFPGQEGNFTLAAEWHEDSCTHPVNKFPLQSRRSALSPPGPWC